MGVLSAVAQRVAGGHWWTVVGLNLVPVAGVAFLGWDVWTILVVYWLENAFAGIFAFLRIGIAEGVPRPGATDVFSSPGVTRQALQFFLLLHYGLFWILMSQLVFGLVPGILGPDAGPLPVWPLLLLAVVPLALARWREYRQFIDGGEYRRATPSSQMWAPYPRVAVLQGAILGAAIIGSLLPDVLAPLAVICAKAAYEVAVELRVGPFAILGKLIDPEPEDAPVETR